LGICAFSRKSATYVTSIKLISEKNQEKITSNFGADILNNFKVITAKFFYMQIKFKI
jgi:hypothetical protein